MYNYHYNSTIFTELRAYETKTFSDLDGENFADRDEPYKGKAFLVASLILLLRIVNFKASNTQRPYSIQINNIKDVLIYRYYSFGLQRTTRIISCAINNI